MVDVDRAPEPDDLLTQFINDEWARTRRATQPADNAHDLAGAITANLRLKGDDMGDKVTGLPEYVDGLKWDAAYWEWMARFGRRGRIWRSGWDRWALTFNRGGDEFGRHTIVVGPFVVALWSCRCDECKADERALLGIVEAEES